MPKKLDQRRLMDCPSRLHFLENLNLSKSRRSGIPFQTCSWTISVMHTETAVYGLSK